jgi:hypothetical protein
LNKLYHHHIDGRLISSSKSMVVLVAKLPNLARQAYLMPIMPRAHVLQMVTPSALSSLAELGRG